MNGTPDIISTRVIKKKYDSFWHPLPGSLQGMAMCPVLVITQPYTKGSSEEVQLKKMMQACRLEEDKYSVIPLEQDTDIAWHQLRDSLKPEYVILLGVRPVQLGISAIFHGFSPNRFNDCTWILAPSLQEMEQDTEAKKQLWLSGLKPAFVDAAQGNT